jgi:hypothetical protein
LMSTSADRFRVLFCVVDEEQCGDINPLALEPQSIVHLKGFALRLQMPTTIPEEVLYTLGQHEAIVFDGDDLVTDSFTTLLPLFYLDLHLKNERTTSHSHSHPHSHSPSDQLGASTLASPATGGKRALPHLVAFKWHEHTESHFKRTWHNSLVTIDRSVSRPRSGSGGSGGDADTLELVDIAWGGGSGSGTAPAHVDSCSPAS